VMQTLSVSPNLFNCSNVGVSQTVILTVSDRNGSNSCTASITVRDNTAPEITCPANFTVNTESGQCSAVALYTAPTGTDNCNVATTLRTSGPESGAIFETGVTSIIHTVTDNSGNTATCSFTITVTDIELPDVQCFNQTIN